MNYSAKSRSITVVSSLALFIGAGIIFFSLIVPRVGELQELRGERHALQILVEEETESVEAFKELRRRFAEDTNLRDSLSLALPTEEEVPNVVNQLQGIAGLSGIAIQSIDLQYPAIKPVSQGTLIKPVGTIQVNMDALSSYESLKLFVENVETNIRIMDIDTIRIDDEGTGEVVSYNIKIDTYYQR